MPAATTHVEFSKDVYKQLPAVLRHSITNKHMYWLGSQGPDMLFFSRGSVLPGSLKKYGDMMHGYKVPEVISFFENYIDDDPDLRSYFYGYLCHYALDSKVHPLVYALSKAAHEKTGIHEGEQHVTYEANIDVWLMHQRGRLITDYDVHKDLKIDAPSRHKLARMYSAMLYSVYGIKVSQVNLDVAIAEVPFWNGILYPTKKTNDILYHLENMIRIPHVISGIVLYDKNDFSIINLDHKAYPLNYDPEKTISASLPDLYGQALTLAKRLIDHREAADFDINFLGIPSSYANQGA